MISEFTKPVVIISRCLGFAPCRWNGEIIQDDFVDMLKPFASCLTVCPEVGIGLGVPRDPIRIVSVKGNLRLMQPATARDLTDAMQDFSRSFFNSLADPDGFILKSRSPSCGLSNVKMYQGTGDEGAFGKTSGFFGKAVMEKFPSLPVEDEGRLKNYRIRDHFLTRLFTRANFRKLKQQGSMKELIRFHSENKFLLMAYSQKALRVLGRIVANHEKKPVDEVIALYENNLYQAFSHPSRFTNCINVLMHLLGFFAERVNAREKSFFLESLERYRNEKIPLSVPKNMIRSWVIRFEEQYLMNQSFFEPYPEALVEITDSGKERDLTK
jgi:uncharacterized protein YbgA (DUF1722 family)/uncharacterized protein YbbK (DUF523 family)